jgi:hypothetical protein
MRACVVSVFQHARAADIIIVRSPPTVPRLLAPARPPKAIRVTSFDRPLALHQIHFLFFFSAF